MKKILLILAMVSFGTAFAQETETVSAQRQNDIMISPIELIAFPALNVSYERLLNQDSGLGINLITYLGNIEDNSAFTQISPYYRAYFGKKYGAGFFVEGFVPITMTKDVVYYSNNGPYDSRKEEKNTTFGAGVGFGGKWLAKKNIIFEASFGIARRFGTKNDVSNITGKGMLGIGYRF